MVDEKKQLVVFQDKKIRRVLYNGEWYFSVVDVVGVLTESTDPRTYWKVLKHRLIEEDSNETVTKCNQLKLLAEDGKLRETDCANVQTLFRITQSIPSKKAEPFKLWLAKVGYERVQEIDNPELAQKRMKELYKQKGYSEDWIEKRVRGIAIREELTDEWKKRGVQEGKEYAILTNEISKATFGKTVEEYKDFKGINKQNLRDHMTDLELIFGMLGERVTTEVTRNQNAQDFPECKTAATKGGNVAGRARKDAEKEIGRPIVTKENYLIQSEKQKRIK